jgi:hypothetical protein
MASYPPEIALRGRSKNAAGRMVNWRTQFEGESYNQGAILCVMNQRFKVDTYAAQSESAIERIVAKISPKPKA